MDTIYAEGQRRYVESLSAYARQFVGQMQKPRVDHIDGLSPAIAIEQKNLGHTPRSTVGTVTEIYDYLRILFARLGTPYCPACDVPIGTQTVDEIVAKVIRGRRGNTAVSDGPGRGPGGAGLHTLWHEIRAGGYLRIRVDGAIHTIDAPPAIDRRRGSSGGGGGGPDRRPPGPRGRGSPRRSRAASHWAKACCTSPANRPTAATPAGKPGGTASTWPAINAAAASNGSLPTTSPSTARSAGARRARGWGRRRERIPPH